MKKYILFTIVIFSTFFLQAKEEVITKSFDSQKIDAVRVTSKFGRVKVEHWAKNEIAVKAIIRVSSSKEKSAEKVLSNVGVSIAEKGNYLNVETTFQTFFTFMKFSNNLFRNGEFSIDYEIKMPKHLLLDITLNNGDIILYERDANVKISHSNGNISIQSIKGKAKLALRSSNLKIEKVDSLLLDIRNSSLFLEECDYIKAESYNSVYQIDKTRELEANSMRDDFKINQVADILTTSSLSDFNIGTLQRSAVTETNYGDFTVEHIGSKFDEIKMTSKGTKVALFLSPTPANIAISHHQSTKFDIPDSLGLQMKFDETPKYFITKGTVGSPKNGNKILINIKGGNLQLR